MMMTLERWQQVKELFHSALEREPADRSVFLDEACASDEQLREEVLSLIASHEIKGSFLDAPAYEVAAHLLTDAPRDMASGRLIGHYKILELLGRGGMGEIYLAEDTRLDRKVALKLLPAQWTEDAARLSRFQREARAASGLNHPNILTIYEIGETAGVHFIATEFIAGQTLRQRMNGRMNLGALLDISVQVASALSAAHEAGIIHRDIKPENVMVRTDGILKVLDFGLAKLVEHPEKHGLDEAAKVLSNTQPGIVMGTVQYMSPEQARGQEVDARTDIWSLGCVLYEMVTGRAPFEGPTMTDVLAMIIERDPVPVSQVLDDSPAELEWIIRKALRKDRDERYQTTRELLGDLRGLKDELEFEARLELSVPPEARVSQPHAVVQSIEPQATPDNQALPTSAVTAQTTATSVEAPVAKIKKRSAAVYALVALACLAVSVAGLGAYKFLRLKKAAVPFEKVRITQLTTSRNLIHTAISPDGNYMAYVVSDREQHSLWLRQVSAANDTLIVPPAPVGFWGVTFSRDGKELYYVTRGEDGVSVLHRIPALGGTPRKVLMNVDGPVSFSPDGRRMAFVRGNFPSTEESAIIIANSEGGSEQTLAVRKRPDRFYPLYFTGPSWSPDGELIACAMATGPTGGAFYAFKVKDGTPQQLTPPVFTQLGRVEWLKDMSGLIVVASDQFTPSLPGQLWFVSYPGGELRKVTNDLNAYRGLSVAADSTRVVTSFVNEFSNLWVAPDGDASRARQIAPVRSRGGVALTPDGRVVYSTETNGAWDLWIMNADGSNRRQLTNDMGQNIDPVVSPDGRYVVFMSARPGSVDIWRMDITGRNAVQLTSGAFAFHPTFSADGRWVVFIYSQKGGAKIRKVPVEGGEPVEISDLAAYRPSVSPDGKWIACFTSGTQSSQGERYRTVAIIPFEGGAPVRTLEIAGNLTTRDGLQWAPNSRAVLYNLMTDNVSNIWKLSIDGGPPVRVTDFKEDLINDFAWSSDGRQLVATRGTVIRDAIMITDLK